MLNVASAAGQVSLPVKYMEQLPGLCLDQSTALCFIVADKLPAHVLSIQVTRLAVVDTVTDDEGGNYGHAGELRAVGHERKEKVGISGRMCKRAGGVVQGNGRVRSKQRRIPEAVGGAYNGVARWYRAVAEKLRNLPYLYLRHRRKPKPSWRVRSAGGAGWRGICGGCGRASGRVTH